MRRILVVLDDAGPGDALRSRSALDALREAHPESRITLLVGEQAAAVFEGNETVDRVVVSWLYRRGTTGAWGRRLYKLGELARLVATVGVGYDLVLVLNWGTFTLDLLARIAGRTVVGYPNRLAFLTSDRLGAYDVDGDPAQQNRALLSAAGVAEAPRRPPDIGVPTREPYAVLHTGSDWACQQWRQSSWAEVADWLVDECGLAVVFTGLMDELGYVSGIQSLMSRPSTSRVGSTSVEQLTDLLRRATLLVTVDSAPYELAQTTGTPTVVLAGPTSAAPQMGGISAPLLVNRTPPELRRQILACQRTFADGRCHDYACPFAQLPSIRVEDVTRAILQMKAVALPVPG